MDFLNDLKGNVSDAYNTVETGLSNAKKSFGRALVEATDLTPADMRAQDWAKENKANLKEYAAEAADLVLPGTADAIPIGKIVKGVKSVAKMSGAAKKVIDAVKDGSKISKLEDVGLKSANLPELTRKGSENLGKPVYGTGELGKVTNIETTADRMYSAQQEAMKIKTAERVASQYAKEALEQDLKGVNREKILNNLLENASKDSRLPQNYQDTLKEKLISTIYKKK